MRCSYVLGGPEFGLRSLQSVIWSNPIVRWKSRYNKRICDCVSLCGMHPHALSVARLFWVVHSWVPAGEPDPPLALFYIRAIRSALASLTLTVETLLINRSLTGHGRRNRSYRISEMANIIRLQAYTSNDFSFRDVIRFCHIRYFQSAVIG